MKILHTVEFYHPNVGGAQEVVKQLSERMAALGHDVTVATTKIPERNEKVINGVKIEEFDISGNAVNGYKGDPESYKNFLRNSNFDVIMNYAAQEWTADLFFEVIDEVKGKKVFVPCGYSALYDPSYKDYFEKLPGILKKYDASVYLSDTYRDIEFARENGLSNTVVIPNAAGRDEFEHVDEVEKKRFRERYGIRGQLITTLGNHTNEKGHTESLFSFLFAPIWNATFLIVGKSYPNAGCYESCKRKAERINKYGKFFGKKVILLTLPRDETVQALKASDIFIFLSNIECSPLVLFEAAAAGVPFIASEAGNDAEIASWTGGGIIVRSHSRPNGRVQASIFDAVYKLTRLFFSRKKRKTLAESGRRIWLERFTWEKVTQDYLELYDKLIKG